MPFCAKCGASMDPNAQFCPSCGTPVGLSVPAPAPSYSPGATRPVQRPAGVTILAVLAALGGLATLVFGLIFTLFGFGLVFVVIGLLEFGVAYGFWTGASWAWWLGMIVAVLNILSIVTFDVIGLIVGLIILYYLTRPHVKVWFKKT
jgi:hypothetical protein